MGGMEEQVLRHSPKEEVHLDGAGLRPPVRQGAGLRPPVRQGAGLQATVRQWAKQNFLTKYCLSMFYGPSDLIQQTREPLFQDA